MKQVISTKHVIHAPIEKVWANISKGTGVNEWLPVITACRLDGNQRVCSTAQGDMDETILSIDHENRLFQYGINSQPLLPIADVVGTMQLSEVEGKTLLTWDLGFTMQDPDSLPMVRQAVEAMYAAGALGLETISQ